MSTPQPPSELDRELRQPIDKEFYTILWSGNPARSINDVIYDLKQAVDKHVIGSNLDRYEWRSLPSDEAVKAELIRQTQRDEQRKSLWGDKS